MDMDVTPRLKQILLIMLREEQVLPVKELAVRIGVSKRTVQRELEYIGTSLKPYRLTFETKTGAGVWLSGSAEDKKRLLEELQGTDNYDVGNREERRKRLILEILKEKGLKKLFYYSSQFQVSEATVSADLEAVEGWLKSHGLIVTRKPGSGIEVNGTEKSYRRAIRAFIEENIDTRMLRESYEVEDDAARQDLNFGNMSHILRDNVLKRVVGCISSVDDKRVLTLTESSYVGLALHVSIAMSRILKNEIIEPKDDWGGNLAEDNDYSLAEEIIQGLLAHLQPTFIRLAYDMKISNPVLDEIKRSYPEIFERSRNAAAVLERWIGKQVPETEIGFLTIHFGAAQVRLEGKKENLRQVSVGIVCASGIGISRLMLSKLEKIFKESIQMEAYGQNDITPYIVSKTDFFVSSIKLKQLDADVLLVNPLLSDEDIEHIRKKIFHYERIPAKEQKDTKFTMELEQVNILAMQIKTILQYIEVFKVSNAISFEELVSAISGKMSPYRDRQVMIQEDIEERERLGSQIFAEFGFALLHTRSKGVVRPSFSVCVTRDGKAFYDPYFKGISLVIVMLLPIDENIRVNSEILGYISSVLIEDYDFLTTIAKGEKMEIRDALSARLRTFFNQYLNKMQ